MRKTIDNPYIRIFTVKLLLQDKCKRFYSALRQSHSITSTGQKKNISIIKRNCGRMENNIRLSLEKKKTASVEYTKWHCFFTSFFPKRRKQVGLKCNEIIAFHEKLNEVVKMDKLKKIFCEYPSCKWTLVLRLNFSTESQATERYLMHINMNFVLAKTWNKNKNKRWHLTDSVKVLSFFVCIHIPFKI